MEAYLDNSATTRTAAEVTDLMVTIMRKDYGNPSSKHTFGVAAENYIKEARRQIAQIVKCQEKEIVFTSGGTESNNMAVIGAALANKRRGSHVIVSSVEHSSVKEPFRYLSELGFEVTYLPVDKEGVVSPDVLRKALRPDTVLVATMMVNNEIGSIEPIAELGRVVHSFDENIVFFVDAIQAFGKLPVIPKKMDIDLFSVSGHKIHGPKGSGFLYIRDRVKVKPLLLGGGQQQNMRSGTENVPAIAGLGLAAKLAYSGLPKKADQMYALKESFTEAVSGLSGTRINGPQGRAGAPHIVSVSFEGVRAEVLLHALEDKQVYVSSGSACSSNRPELSSTLQAIGLQKELLDATLRFSFSFDTTKEELDYCVQTLSELLPVLRRYTVK